MKKAISIILVFAMVSAMALAGCGEENVVVSNTFKIGGLGPLTGSSSFYGEEVRNGAQLAVDEINAHGGICEKQVELNFLDDEADPQKVIEAYEELKEWGVHAIVGATTSDACIALAAETGKDNIFQITPSSSAESSVNNYNVFQVCFSDPNQGAAAAEYIVENALGSKVAIIYDTSSTYSTGIFRGFSEKAHEIGLDMVAIKGFDSTNNEDFSEALLEIKSLDADIVFLPVYYQQASIILQQASNIGYTPQFFGCDGIEGILGVEGFEAEAAEGMIYLTPYVEGEMSKEAKAFSQKYEETYGTKPSQFAADAYDAVYIIKEAADEAGITIDMTAEAMCNSMVGAMIVIEFKGITSAEGTKMRWDENGMVDKTPKAAIIIDGEYQLM